MQWNLPSEILSDIFKIHAPPPLVFSVPIDYARIDFGPESLHPHITYAAVSSYWRQVVHSTPELWTPVKLKLTSPEDRIRKGHILSLYLRYSANLPIHLFLYYSHYPSVYPSDTLPEGDILVEPSVDSLLLSNMGRIHTLSLWGAPVAWFSHLSRTSAMVDLSIRWKDSHPTTEILFEKCQTLRRLSVHAIDSPDKPKTIRKLPSSITVLDLHDMPIDTCIQYILLAPNVTEVYIHHARGWHKHWSIGETVEPWFRNPIVLEHLHTLHWDHFASGLKWGNEFLRHAHTPALRTLRLADTDKYVEASQTKAFTERLSQCFKVLEIEKGIMERGMRSNALFIVLNSMSSVETLVLINCDCNFLANLFDHLTPPHSGRGARTLPTLETMSIRGCIDGHFGLKKSEAIKRIVPMLEQRLAGINDTFCLEFSSIELDWSSDIRDGFRGLVERGARLKIVVDSKTVDWLE